MSDILWLTKKNFSSAQEFMISEAAKLVPLPVAEIAFHSINNYIPDLLVRKPKTKDKWIINEARRETFFEKLNFYIDNVCPKIIVINCPATLELVTGYNSLDLCRGSVYIHRDIPCIVVDDVLKLHTVNHFSWLLNEDLKKVGRWLRDERRVEPKFSYTVCDNRNILDTMVNQCSSALLIATDIETSHKFISCIGYSCLLPDGRILSYVVPFIDPTKPDACYWPTREEEEYAWKCVREVNANSVPKTQQGGQYDSAYHIKFRIPLHNYLLDSLHLFHSIWTEAPKKLNFISSVLLDHCQYWKDESKGEKKDENKNERIPQTEIGMSLYWRYNALDCWHTLLDTIFLMRLIVGPRLTWALSNYNVEFSLQVGPALAGTMYGLRVDKRRQFAKRDAWGQDMKNALATLRIMVDDEDFNPNSPSQVASLIFDVLGAKPIKKRGKRLGKDRSVGEKVLENIKTQHPMYGMYIDQIWGTKKPKNNIAKYGPAYVNEDGKFAGMWLENGRWMYALSAAGTETGRFAGKSHHFWLGQAPQNVPEPVRDIAIADTGYFFFEADYSQSDAYYIAHEAEDEKYIATMLGDRDTHCVHVEFFFKRAYEEVYQGYKDKAFWVVDSLTGVRQNTKRIVHGSNFQMAGFTLYITMGHDAVMATATMLGHKNPHSWAPDIIYKFCQSLLDSYHILYPRLRPWFKESLDDAIEAGNRVTCAFGRTRLFFGDMAANAAIQRELSAYYGQGGTSGAINRTLLDYYYGIDLEEQGIMFLTQTHDSILWQVPLDKVDIARKLLTLMDQPCTIKGRTFTVPSEAKCGFSWGDRCMISYNPAWSDTELIAKMQAHEVEWNKQYDAA